MFCGAEYTRHTLIRTNHKTSLNYNIERRGRKSRINKFMRNPAGIKLCISKQQTKPSVRGLPCKITILIKAVIKTVCNKWIHWPDRLTPLPTITLFYSHHDPDLSGEPMHQKHPRLDSADTGVGQV